MSRDGVSGPQPILHIGCSKGTTAPPGWGAVGEGFALVFCPDVFRALARVADDPPAAVVVCVDDLHPEEYQFFRIMRRQFLNVPVFVYVSRVHQEQTSLAVRAGATDAWTPEFATRLGKRLESYQVERELRASGLVDRVLTNGGKRSASYQPGNGHGTGRGLIDKKNGSHAGTLDESAAHSEPDDSDGAFSSASHTVDEIDRWLMDDDPSDRNPNTLRFSTIGRGDGVQGIGEPD